MSIRPRAEQGPPAICLAQRWTARLLALACIAAGTSLSGCADGGAPKEANPSAMSPAAPPSSPAERESAGTSSRAERAATLLEANYRTLRLSFARDPRERDAIAQRIDSYTTKKADCSPTGRRYVFNCSMSLASRGYAPGIEQYRFIVKQSGYRIVPQ